MNSYHTRALSDADIFTVMGSIYAEVARYDSAIEAGRLELAAQAVSRAEEIMNFAQNSGQLNGAQKMELKKFAGVFSRQASRQKKSDLDGYLMPFALAARLRA